MTSISSGIAFWIFDAWRKTKSQLQVDTIVIKDSRGSPAVIWKVSPKDSIISLVALDDKGQNLEWRLSLADAHFSFGVIPEVTPFPEFMEGIWVSQLLAQFPSGNALLFGERFVEEG